MREFIWKPLPPGDIRALAEAIKCVQLEKALDKDLARFEWKRLARDTHQELKRSLSDIDS